MSDPRSKPRCSIVIPTRDRLDALERCLRSLAGIDPGLAEVLVGVDGPDAGEAGVVSRLGSRARVLTGQPGGPGAARNRAILEARGEVLLLLNDDVEASPGLVEAHLRAHDERGRGSPAMVLGSAPWAVHEPDRVFDRLIRETSMVFFYDTMDDADPGRDWGFRHAWTLNLSVPKAVARESAGPRGRGVFDESLPDAAFEDLEWAWRVRERTGAPVLYRPDASVTHHHRYEPRAYFERERRLGRDAWALAGANPACAREVFGRDVRTREEVEYSEAFVARERVTVGRLEAAFLRQVARPAASATGELIEALYGQHLLIKRWHWRCGLLEGAGKRHHAGEPEPHAA
ncbi:MAG: glycosyltransferase family 2 protein [Phycisphaerales bacterium JB040]